MIRRGLARWYRLQDLRAVRPQPPRCSLANCRKAYGGTSGLVPAKDGTGLVCRGDHPDVPTCGDPLNEPTGRTVAEERHLP